MSAAEIGVIGLGTMGAMLALNIADNGFSVAVHNRTAARIPEFLEKAGDLAEKITGHAELKDFVQGLASPRNIILMVPAGDAVDAQIAQLRPLLDAEDMIIDAGNANFHDSERRANEAEKAGIPFLGIGVSGGAEGARFGPSIMGGGQPAAWDRVAHILKAISAKYEGQPCATYMGIGGAGHFVKTVHNGIEYADMQLIAEAYGVMRDGMGMDAAACGAVFDQWNEGLLQSYLIEISGRVSAATDPETGTPMLDMILDRAGQKGTGRWTVIESQMLGAPVPVIEAAVVARNLSAARDLRLAGSEAFGSTADAMPSGALSFGELEQALIAGKILSYAQGFELLTKASADYGWALPMAEIAEVWREGCIIRSAMLNDMASALTDAPERNLALAPYFANILKANMAGLRKVAVTAMGAGQPVPALAAALNYFDTLTSARTTANMLQAQRDYFGAHSFERTDNDGAHHGPWLDQHLNG
ncbi:6-phosphogluconate dehydrogenase, decarboxylating [Tateyamaria omphalii]|uniref:NADP-dependent phosphogluconate dehydrogenase n=1 Tax=Tateyamaria omphalii TaxID=299262 RepID=UPI0016769792|nr:NADP-dependent phosphogluconate dehydrogenase [Tateyamaria omphalii]GGX67306.1 6-phosphogluconate dehydrogenase, decarboxylating [Tateyamaria omphalii]